MSGNQNRADVLIHHDRVELVGDVEAEDVTIDGVGSLAAELADVRERLDTLEEYHAGPDPILDSDDPFGRSDDYDLELPSKADEIDLGPILDYVDQRIGELEELHQDLKGLQEVVDGFDGPSGPDRPDRPDR